jgi:hypothetical protein
MTNVNKGHNTASDFDIILSSAMDTATTNENTQAKMTVAMFEREVTFSIEHCRTILQMKGSDKTAKVDETLRELSPAFADVLVKLAEKEAMRKAAKHGDQTAANFVITYKAKVAAARKMFGDALKCTYALHSLGVVSAELARCGGGQRINAYSYKRDDEGNIVKVKGSEVFVETMFSNRELIKEANNALKPVTSGASASTTGNVVSQSQLLSGANSLAAGIASAAKSGSVDFDDVLADSSSAAGKAIRSVFDQVFDMLFLDGGTYDLDTIKEYVSERNQAANADKVSVKKKAA